MDKSLLSELNEDRLENLIKLVWLLKKNGNQHGN
jgi:hypothetical protein